VTCGLRFAVLSTGYRVYSLGVWVRNAGIRDEGLWFMVCGLGSGVLGTGFGG